MYVGVIAVLLGSGMALSWAAISRPSIAAQLESISGLLLIAGLALLGLGLPIMRCINPG